MNFATSQGEHKLVHLGCLSTIEHENGVHTCKPPRHAMRLCAQAQLSTMMECRRFDPSFADSPFFCPVPKGMIAMGSFVKADGGVHGVVSCDLSKQPVLINEYVTFKEAKLSRRQDTVGSLDSFAELVQTTEVHEMSTLFELCCCVAVCLPAWMRGI